MSSLVALLLLAAGDLDAAEKALAAGKYARAVELLGDLADGDGADVSALVVYGRAQLGLREYEAAVDPLLRASDARPADKALAGDAARACWGSARGRFARAYLDDARRYAARSGDARLMADLDYAAGEYEAALKRYRALPENHHTANRAGLCLRALGKEKEARQAFLRALEHAISSRDLSKAWQAARDADAFGRLHAWLDGEVTGSAGDYWSRLYRGYARAELRLLVDAAVDLRQAVRMQPERLSAKGRLCSVLMELGRRDQKADALDEAERLAREVLARDKSERQAWSALYWLAGYAFQNRDVERSYRVLRYLWSLDATDRLVGLNLGAMARRLGHYDEAMAAFDALLAVDPEDPDVLNDSGILKDARGDRAGAVALWRRVLDVEPQNLNALENLFTDAWERGDRAAMDELGRRGLAAARLQDKEGLVVRWRWFLDRRLWAPKGFR